MAKARLRGPSSGEPLEVPAAWAPGTRPGPRAAVGEVPGEEAPASVLYIIYYILCVYIYNILLCYILYTNTI